MVVSTFLQNVGVFEIEGVTVGAGSLAAIGGSAFRSQQKGTLSVEHATAKSTMMSSIKEAELSTTFRAAQYFLVGNPVFLTTFFGKESHVAQHRRTPALDKGHARASFVAMSNANPMEPSDAPKKKRKKKNRSVLDDTSQSVELHRVEKLENTLASENETSAASRAYETRDNVAAQPKSSKKKKRSALGGEDLEDGEKRRLPPGKRKKKHDRSISIFYSNVSSTDFHAELSVWRRYPCIDETKTTKRKFEVDKKTKRTRTYKNRR